MKGGLLGDVSIACRSKVYHETLGTILALLPAFNTHLLNSPFPQHRCVESATNCSWRQ